MATITFDTLKFSDTLKAAGVPPAQADAEARAFVAAIGEVDVATRRDIDELRRTMRRDIEDARKDMRTLESRLIIKLGVFITVASTVASGIIIAVLRVPH